MFILYECYKKYGLPFLIGGTAVSDVKWTSHHMPQKYAAIVGALPLGLLSTLFIIEANKTDAYIKNYTIQTFVTVLAGLGYLIGSHTYYKFSKKQNDRDITKERVKVAYIISVIAWFVLSVLKLEIIK